MSASHGQDRQRRSRARSDRVGRSEHDARDPRQRGEARPGATPGRIAPSRRTRPSRAPARCRAPRWRRSTDRGATAAGETGTPATGTRATGASTRRGQPVEQEHGRDRREHRHEQERRLVSDEGQRPHAQRIERQVRQEVRRLVHVGQQRIVGAHGVERARDGQVVRSVPEPVYDRHPGEKREIDQKGARDGGECEPDLRPHAGTRSLRHALDRILPVSGHPVVTRPPRPGSAVLDSGRTGTASWCARTSRASSERSGNVTPSARQSSRIDAKSPALDRPSISAWIV